MRTIHKEAINRPPLGQVTELALCEQAKILTIKTQGGQPTIWYECNTETTFRTTIRLQIVHTGEELEDLGPRKYLTTLLLGEGSFVVHFYLLT